MATERTQVTDRSEILNTLVAILEPWLEDGDAGLNEQTNLLGELGLDSVAILQLVLGIEKEFAVTLKDSELDAEVFSQMANLVTIIEGKLHAVD